MGSRAVLVAVALMTAAAGCSREAAPAPPSTAAAGTQPAGPPAGDPVEGLRVASRVGCNGCHGADGSGRVFHENEAEGRLVAPNLTQRRGLYDDAALEALLRRGITHDGHVPLAMPIKMFQHLSDREIRDITAWLRALPAVHDPDLPEGAWSDALKASVADGTFVYLDDMRPDPGNQPPAQPPTEPRALGRHLAMTSCSECHAWDLNGWPGDSAPSLVVAKAYSAEDFTRLMRTGITATGKESATGLMTQMGRQRFHVMTDDEIAALKLFLDTR